MVIQFWIIIGFIVGWLASMILSRSYGISGDILFGIVGGLVGGSLAAILFVVSGIVVNEANAIAAIIAFTCAVILLTIKRVVIQPNRLST